MRYLGLAMLHSPHLQLCTTAVFLGVWFGLGAGCRVYEADRLSQRGDSSDAAVREADASVRDGAVEDGGRSDFDGGFVDPNSCEWGMCWWSDGGVDTCESAGVPSVDQRPEGEDDIGSVSDIYLGFTQVRLGSTNRDGEQTQDAWEDFGFDLDGTCTNSATCTGGDAVSCLSSGPEIPYDGQLCRDNTFARLQPVVAAVPELGETFGLGEDTFNCELWRGGYTMILRISGYSGELDDPRVRVDIYASTGIQDSVPWTCPAEDYRTRYPRWLSSRKWGVARTWLAGPITSEGTLPDSIYADPDAYVRNGYLVAQMPDGAEQGFIGDGEPYRGFLFKTHKSVYVGHLQKMQNGTWAIRDGLAAGRIAKGDLVQAFREIGFCEDGNLRSFYENMLAYVDENADVLASGANDPTLDCDAMSYGIAFQAAQLVPGSAVDVPERLECCPPGKTREQCTAKCGDGTVSGDEQCDTAIPAGQPGACPTSCPTTDACTPQVVTGTECSATCTPMPITMVGAKDGCCPRGANATTDSDCRPACGNGVVEAGETCDPPSSCMRCNANPSHNNGCSPRVMTGTPDSCNVRCEVRPITQCRDADRCCPNGCSEQTDNDCSASCGNGVIDSGETCEANTEQPCTIDCDDGQACTLDETIGSADNCNVTCSHSPITEPANDDGCCPEGATANADNDCVATCGNGVIEGDEQCDDGNAVAGDNCFDCKTETQEQICLAKLAMDDACTACTCRSCAAQAIRCYGNPDANEVMLCSNMVDCGRRTDCGDPDCFCGGVPLFSCLLVGGDGPCQREVSAAAKTNSLFDIQARSGDLAFPLGRANALGDCVDDNCAAECGR